MIYRKCVNSQVRPQLPQLTCLVQMNNQSFEKNYIDVPLESFNANNSRASTEPKIKQEVIPMPNIVAGTSRQLLSSAMNPQMDLSRTNDTIEYISNDMDDDNIQGTNIKCFICRISIRSVFVFFQFTVVNVYTTHMPEISTTLPTIIMQDDASVLNSSATSLHNHLSLPSDSYSLIGEDLIKHSFSDEDSSDDQSDVEIDL